MVSLVEDIEKVPNNKISSSIAIQYQYAFALNRRNTEGDRDKALTVITQVSIDRPTNYSNKWQIPTNMWYSCTKLDVLS